MSSGSESEGEIIETEAEKATTALPSVNGAHVDSQSRSRPGSASASPRATLDGGSERYRSRSPYRHGRSPRGEKRRREEDYYDERDYSDPRRFKVYYENHHSSDDARRNRVSYADLDRSAASAPGHGKGSRILKADGHWDDRARTRSRSPRHISEVNDRKSRYGRSDEMPRRDFDDLRGKDRDRDRRSRKEDMNRSARDQPARDKAASISINRQPNHAAGQPHGKDKHLTNKKYPSIAQEISDKRLTVDSHQSNEDSSDKQSEDVGTLDEAALIEARRKRREAIKAKHKSSATPLMIKALHIGDATGTVPLQDSSNSAEGKASVSPLVTPSVTPQEESPPGSPAEFAFGDDEELANCVNNNRANDEAEGPSAADYDPTVDMQEDHARHDQRQHFEEMPAQAYQENKSDKQVVLIPDGNVNSVMPPNAPKDDFDMFADGDDDMFAPNQSTSQNLKLESTKAVHIPQAKELDMSLLDNWDDPDGYYRVILGELLDGRYHVQSNLGKGMFSNVVRALDNKTKKIIAIKIIRNNDTMKKAGLKEIAILQQLASADPEDKKHVIRLERHFEHKAHLCMVFENLSINLREVLKKFGRDVGINLRAVRSYAQQMFLGLSLLRKCNILHADLKPDNVLVNESRNVLKICDLGSAADASESDITPYLVSRFYRAPEIILGLPYDFAIDTWSVGCTLFELYTGKILFTGRNNNQMLRSIMECRGKFASKLLRKAEFAGVHFDDDLLFRSMERDKITGKDVVRMMNFVKPTRDLRSRLLGTAKGLGDVEVKEINLFTDLLDRCLNLNPEKRCTPAEALRHPFINRGKP